MFTIKFIDMRRYNLKKKEEITHLELGTVFLTYIYIFLFRVKRYLIVTVKHRVASLKV